MGTVTERTNQSCPTRCNRLPFPYIVSTSDVDLSDEQETSACLSWRLIQSGVTNLYGMRVRGLS